jgi:hypothetical protein
VQYQPQAVTHGVRSWKGGPRRRMFSCNVASGRNRSVALEWRREGGGRIVEAEKYENGGPPRGHDFSSRPYRPKLRRRECNTSEQATRATTSPIARSCDRTLTRRGLSDRAKRVSEMRGKGGEPNFMSGCQRREETRTPVSGGEMPQRRGRERA